MLSESRTEPVTKDGTQKRMRRLSGLEAEEGLLLLALHTHEVGAIGDLRG